MCAQRLFAEKMDTSLAIWLTNQQHESPIIGYVHSVFEKVINFISVDQKRLFSIGNSAVMMSPQMIKVREVSNFLWFDESINPSKPIYLIDNKLVIVDTLELYFEKAERWNGSIDRFSPFPFSRLILLKIIQEITLVIEQEGKDGGFRTVWLSFMKKKNLPMTHTHEREIAKRFERLCSLTDEENWEAVYGAAKQFGGLGLGLTPSGDDFLTGWLLTLMAFDHPIITIFMEKKEEWLGFLKDRTTDISYFMLEAVMNGQGNEAVIELLQRHTEKEAIIKKLLRKVLSLGSISGTDMLAGIGFALEMMLTTRRRELNDIQGHY